MKLIGYRSNWKLVLIFTLVLVLLMAWIFFSPNPYDLSKYPALLEKGQLDDCRTGITRLLQDRPGWHEGRALLVEVELKARNYGSAAAHLAILAQAGWDTSVLEQRFLSLPLSDISAVVNNLDFNDPWSQVFAVKVSLSLPDSQIFLDSFTRLFNSQPDNPLLDSIRQSALNDNNVLLAGGLLSRLIKIFSRLSERCMNWMLKPGLLGWGNCMKLTTWSLKCFGLSENLIFLVIY